MRVLHVITRLGVGGAEGVARTIASGLREQGVAAAMIPVAAATHSSIEWRIRDELAASGVTALEGSRARAAKLAVFEAACRIRRGIRQFAPDIVHLHTEIPEFAWALSASLPDRAKRPSLVRTIHNAVLWERWKPLGRFAESRLGQARAVAVSTAAARGLAEWRRLAGQKPIPCVVVYNGIACSSGSRQGRIARRNPRLGFVGRLETQKGVDVLMRALDLLEGAGGDFEVDIIGDGALAEAIRSEAHRLNRHVVVHPPQWDARNRLADYDAILMPSRFEGLPLLALEALCLEVPVIATSAPGLDEAIPPWYPHRSPPGDASRFAESISAFLLAPETWTAVAAAARTWVVERFSVKEMLTSYARAYAEVLQAPQVAAGPSGERSG